MPFTSSRALLSAVIITMAVAGSFFLAHQTTSYSGKSDPYYRKSLSNEGILVERGADARLVYAREMGQRTPLFALAGVDLNALKDAADALDALARAYAARQASFRDGLDVLTALYPTGSLRAFAQAESARRVFIENPSGTNERRYSIQLDHALKLYARDIEKYSRAFERIENEELSFVVPTGKVTKQSIRKTLLLLVDAAQNAKVEMRRRNRCVKGNVADCRESDVRIPELLSETSAPLALPTASTMQVVDIRERAGFGSVDRGVVRLENSSCLATFPPPHDMVVQRGPTDASASIRYAGDILFYPAPNALSSNGATMSHYLAESGASYILYDPMSFYICPFLSDDIARVVSVKRIADMEHLSPWITSEPSALRLLVEALRKTSDEETLSLALMYAQRTAGFHYFVEQVAAVADMEIKMMDVGLPVDGGAKRLFATQSGFPELFLSSNRSFAGKHLYVFESTDSSSLTDRLVRWSDVRYSTPPEKIIADLSLFLKTHGGAGSLGIDQ